jgi:glycerol kinase
VRILAIDVGTSSVRVAVVGESARPSHVRGRRLLPDTPAPGLVEVDARAMADVVVELARQVLAEAGPVDAVGIANQRATTVVWDRATGQPVGPALGWQDLRTVGECLVLHAEGVPMAPNQSATKLAHLLDVHDPERSRDLCFGTVDCWLAWCLSEGSVHVSDLSNVGVTGLVRLDGQGWDPAVLERLRIPAGVLPAIVDSTAVVGEARALPGAPPIAGLLGDQQASLLGQGCVRPGQAKATFGTGAMLDVVIGADRPAFATRGPGGTFPVVALRREGEITWGVEAIMLSAGSNVEWLRDDLGLLDEVAGSHEVAARCQGTDGVVFVPALLGLGTPHWDYGARGTLLGVTRGTGRPQVVRAVLEGVAQRGADLLEAAELDAGLAPATLRVDGGMSQNPTFVQALADATQRVVETSPVVDATTLGAAFAAGLAVGAWGGLDDIGATWRPASVVEPGAPLDRARWQGAVEHAKAWYPELSALDL